MSVLNLAAIDHEEHPPVGINGKVVAGFPVHAVAGVFVGLHPATLFEADNAHFRVGQTPGDGRTGATRFDERQCQSKPVVDKLRKWLDRSLVTTAPGTALGKALTYLDNQWSRLIGYLDDGAYPIDNNRAENAIRPFVVGRKN